ncbi:uncharacterized protein LOC135840643 [Planococcus citri]|uniref:uncharacterized protein LOC135840643 n=1 Tax=Planococcus citri TaxID=170843 RepID=UPI0031F80AC8
MFRLMPIGKCLFFFVLVSSTLSQNDESFVKRNSKFDLVRLRDHYVDKTEILNVIFEQYTDTQCLYLSAARGFGSTMNLELVDFFSNVEAASPYDDYKVVGQYAHSVLQYGYHISFDKQVGLRFENLNWYVVVHLRLWQFKQFETRFEFQSEHIAWILNKMIALSHRRWKWLSSETEYLKDHTRKRFPGYYHRAIRFLRQLEKTKFQLDKIANVLKTYAKLLVRFFGMISIFLVDDYDTVFRYALQHSKSGVEKYYRYLNRMLLPLVQDHCKYVYKVIITGTTTLPLYAGGCNLAPMVKKFAFLREHEFTPYFGFDDEEVEELFATYSIPESEKDELKELANGYRTLAQNSTTRYNAHSTMSFIRRKCNKTENIFEGTDFQRDSRDQELYFPTPFLKIIPFRYKVIELLHKFDVKFNLTEFDEGAFEQFANFSSLDKSKEQNFSLDLLFTYIFEQGYLALSNVPNKYRIPNKVAMNETWTAMKIYYKDVDRRSLRYIVSYFEDILLAQNNTLLDELKQELQSELTRCFKRFLDQQHFPEIKTPEYLFHSIIYAAIASSSSSAELSFIENELDGFDKSYISVFIPASNIGGVIGIRYFESLEGASESTISDFIPDTRFTEVKYITINIDQHLNTMILM